MNVAIKASQLQLALDIFAEMQAAGCQVRLARVSVRLSR